MRACVQHPFKQHCLLHIYTVEQRFRLLESGSCEYGRKLFEGVGAFALLQDRRRHPDEAAVEPNGGGSPTSSGDGSGRLEGGRGGGDATAERGGVAGGGTSGVVCVATTHLYWHPDG